MARATFYGFSAPFVSGNTILPMQADERLIKNDLLQLFMTIPNERVMRPGWGTDLRNSTFEPSDDNLIGKIRSSIIRSISKYERRVILDNLIVERQQDEHTINIKCFCRAILSDSSSFVVELKLPLGGSNPEAR